MKSVLRFPLFLSMFKYVKKQNVLISNMVSNLSTDFLLKVMGILCLKFGNLTSIGKRLKNFIATPNAANDNSRCAPAYLFLPSGSSESPTPASAEGASREDGLLCGWWCICYLSKTLTVFLIEYLDK